MASTPSAWPSLRMLSASIPPVSARLMAARSTRPLLRGARGAALGSARFDIACQAYAVRCSLRRMLTTYVEGGRAVKAIVGDRYGVPDVLEPMEIETPAPAEDQVLVRVRAASINPADWSAL